MSDNITPTIGQSHTITVSLNHTKLNNRVIRKQACNFNLSDSTCEGIWSTGEQWFPHFMEGGSDNRCPLIQHRNHSALALSEAVVSSSVSV